LSNRTSLGSRALVASGLVLLAWLLTGSAVAGAEGTGPGAPADTVAPVDPTTMTTSTFVDPEPPPEPTTTTAVAAPAATTTTTRPKPKATAAPAQSSTTTTTVPAATREAAVNTPTRPNTNTVTSPPGATDGKASVSLNLDGLANPGKPSQSLLIIVLITLLSVAPALLIMLTSFTRIVIVLSLTRNALGLHTIPPNQVIVGLAMFLSFFVMSPTFGEINKDAVQPLLHGQKTQAQAYDAAVTPLRTFMLKQTRKGELAMFSAAANGGKRPEKPEDVGLAALIPAFILSELKTAFIIGFVVFIPFLVIDIVVSSSLMSMGMMMLPPVFVSLPFKLLLFVMVDGWGLIVRSLLKSFA